MLNCNRYTKPIAAYKRGDGMKIDGKRVLVDVERGRTVEGFLPRRLGGGIGETRKGAPEECQKHSGREPSRSERSDRDRGSRRDDGTYTLKHYYLS
eukprot:Awhi_evm1s10575